jgi:hypothetical protein
MSQQKRYNCEYSTQCSRDWARAWKHLRMAGETGNCVAPTAYVMRQEWRWSAAAQCTELSNYWRVCALCECPSQVLCVRVLVKSGLENRDYGRRGSAALTMRHPLYPQKLALSSPTSGCSSVGIVRSRTKATELVSYMKLFLQSSCWQVSSIISAIEN